MTMIVVCHNYPPQLIHIFTQAGWLTRLYQIYYPTLEQAEEVEK